MDKDKRITRFKEIIKGLKKEIKELKEDNLYLEHDLNAYKESFEQRGFSNLYFKPKKET